MHGHVKAAGMLRERKRAKEMKRPRAHLVAIHIKAVGAVDAFKNDGLAAHRLEGTHWRVDSSRQQRLGLCEDLQAPPMC